MTAALALRDSELVDTTPRQRPVSSMLNRSVNRSSAYPKHAAGAVNLSLETISTSQESLATRIARELSRRVGVGRPISVKQFAYELRVSEQTVWVWMNGNRTPAGEHLVRMIAFLPADFGNAILSGCALVKLSDIRASQAFRDLNAARENAIRALNGTDD